MIPRRRRKEPFGTREPAQIRSSGHLTFIRGFACSILGKHECQGKIEAAHVRGGTDGGLSLKPSDCFVIPLCSEAHREQHQIGEQAFESKYQIKMRAIADRLWSISSHRKKLEQRQ